MADLIIIICFLINFILSFVLLKNNKKLSIRLLISVSITIISICFIGAIVSGISMILGDVIGQNIKAISQNLLATDKQFLFGWNIASFISPVIAYYINKKEKMSNKKIVLKIVLAIIGFIILTTLIFMIVLNTNAWKTVDFLYDIYEIP